MPLLDHDTSRPGVDILTVRISALHGVGLFTKRHLRASEVIMAEKPLLCVVGEIGYIADRRRNPSQPSSNNFYSSLRGLSFTDKINLLQIMPHIAYDFVSIDSVEDLDR